MRRPSTGQRDLESGGLLAEIGVIVGAWLDPKVRGAAVIGLVWMSAALLLYVLRFRRLRAPG